MTETLLFKQKVKCNNIEYTICHDCDADIMLDYMIRSKKLYEHELLEKIKSMELEGRYIDIGANIGTHTLFFLNQCLSTHVDAVEPIPAACKLLKMNLDINDIYDSYTIHQCAIGDKNGRMAVSKYCDDSLGSTELGYYDYGFKTFTIDTLFRKVDDCCLIKIDVEGNECNVIKGAFKFLYRNRPIIVIEALDKDKLDDTMKTIAPYYSCDGINYAPETSLAYIYMPRHDI